jgi:hypothetical protein
MDAKVRADVEHYIARDHSFQKSFDDVGLKLPAAVDPPMRRLR